MDLVETARKMIDAAVAVTTGRLHLTAPSDALLRIAAGDQEAVSSFRFELARQIASALVMMDPNVIAVFEDRDDSALHTVSIDEPLRFWVRVRFQTAALRTVIEALDQALRQAYTLVTEHQPLSLIEVIIVDDQESRILQVGVSRTGHAPVLLVQRG